jgi:hypothetical protein
MKFALFDVMVIVNLHILVFGTDYGLLMTFSFPFFHEMFFFVFKNRNKYLIKKETILLLHYSSIR